MNKWYAFSDKMSFALGPFDTREEAINVGSYEIDGSFTVDTATHVKLRLSAACAIERMLDGDIEYDDSDLFKFDEDKVVGMLQDVLDNWMDEHRHLFPVPLELALDYAGETIHRDLVTKSKENE